MLKYREDIQSQEVRKDMKIKTTPSVNWLLPALYLALAAVGGEDSCMKSMFCPA
jgi:hypothetical protein